MSFRDKSMNMMSALKAASAIKQGSNCSVDELLKDTEKILEHFYEFDFNQKPAIDKKAVVDEVEKANEEISKVVEEQKKEDKPF